MYKSRPTHTEKPPDPYLNINYHTPIHTNGGRSSEVHFVDNMPMGAPINTKVTTESSNKPPQQRE